MRALLRRLGSTAHLWRCGFPSWVRDPRGPRRVPFALDMQIALALVITLVSACFLNLGYLLEHSVASKVPPLTWRRPIASLRSLLGNRRWLAGFGSEALGWILYVVALALAPLSLVQATAAGGIG